MGTAVHPEGEKFKVLWYDVRSWKDYFKDDQIRENRAFKAAMNQRTPFGLNRYIMVVVHMLYTFATGRVYFDWPHFSGILFHYEAYTWLCDPEGVDQRQPPLSKRFQCAEQETAVGDLFGTVVASAFSFSMVAGICLDLLGPKRTAFIGQATNSLAVMLLAVSSQSVNAYIPAFIFLGLGSDTGFLPTLPVANLFPANEGIVIALLGAAKSASFAIPNFLLMAARNNPTLTQKELFLWYMGFGPMLCALTALFLFPTRAYLPWNKFVNIQEDPNDPVASDIDEDLDIFPPPQHTYSIRSLATELRNCSFVGSHHVSSLHHRTPSNAPSHAPSVPSVGSFLSNHSTKTCVIGKPKTDHEKVIDTQPTANFHDSNDGDATCAGKNEKYVEGAIPPITISSQMSDARRISYNEIVSVRKDIEDDEYGIHSNYEEGQPVGNIVVTATLAQQFFSVYNFVIIVYCVVRAIVFTFYTASADRMFDSAVVEFSGHALPFSCVFCLIIGKIVDFYGITIVLFLLNTAIAMAYLFATFQSLATQYISVISQVFYVSFYSTQLYCYVSDTFEAQHFGKFVGITSLISGLCSLLSMPFKTLTNSLFNGNYTTICYIMFGIVCANFGTVAYIFYLKRKNPHPFWPHRIHHDKHHPKQLQNANPYAEQESGGETVSEE